MIRIDDPMLSVGSYPVQMDADQICRMIGEMNELDDAFEGPLPHRIARYGRYELREVPVADLLVADYPFDPDLAAQYAAMDPATRPPCVFDPLEKDIVDGNHRARGAGMNGESSIWCYVGIESSIDPDWSDWED